MEDSKILDDICYRLWYADKNKTSFSIYYLKEELEIELSECEARIINQYYASSPYGAL